MRSWALAILGIKSDELNVMDGEVFWSALRLKREEKDADRRHVGELIRGAALQLWNVQVSKKDRISDPRKFWPMPWDELTETPTAEIERLAELSQEEKEQEAIKFLKRTGQWEHPL